MQNVAITACLVSAVLCCLFCAFAGHGLTSQAAADKETFGQVEEA